VWKRIAELVDNTNSIASGFNAELADNTNSIPYETYYAKQLTK
jgi:hypothetical protein